MSYISVEIALITSFIFVVIFISAIMSIHRLLSTPEMCRAFYLPSSVLSVLAAHFEMSQHLLILLPHPTSMMQFEQSY